MLLIANVIVEDFFNDSEGTWRSQYVLSIDTGQKHDRNSIGSRIDKAVILVNTCYCPLKVDQMLSVHTEMLLAPIKTRLVHLQLLVSHSVLFSVSFHSQLSLSMK